jgi:tetratricopeptide (TPR) repeat protein
MGWTAKGIARPMTRTRPPARSSTGFLGRSRELVELRKGLPAAASGHGFVFLVRGEPGIGKTRIAAELAQEAERRGQRVHWGRCIEGAGAPPFWPWTQVLRSVCSGSQTAWLAEAPAVAWKGLARLVPDLVPPASARSHGSTPGDVARADRTALPAETERFQFFDGIANLLRCAAAVGPFGIVLDDLHAADFPSLHLFDFVARQVATLPLWIIATYRELEARLDPQRAALLDLIGRQGRSWTLGGLSEADVSRLIEQVVGETPAPRLVARVRDLTEGNPFFVNELARLIWSRADEHLERGEAAHLPIPSGVREVVRQRLHPISQACRDMLTVAAVIGPTASFALLREACASEPGRLLDLIQEAVSMNVLEPLPGHRFAFRHALIREALCDGLGSSQRAAMHRLVGEAIERAHDASLDEHLAELAHHFARAAPVANVAKALDYAERAAQRSAAVLAYEDAAGLYQLALDTLPLAPDQVARPREVELLLALGNAQVRAGDTPGARASFQRAADAARARDDALQLAQAALGMGATGLGVPPGTVDDTLVTLLEDALARGFGVISAPTRVRLLARLALELYFSDSVRRRSALMDEAWELTAEADLGTRAYMTHARLVGLWDITPPARRMQWCDDLIALANRAGDDDLALRGHSYRLLEFIDSGMADAWEPELEKLARIAERLREPRFLGMMTGTRAMRSLWLGRVAEAESLGQRALELASSVRDTHTLISVTVQTFFLRRLQGRSAEIETSARASVVTLPHIPGARCMLILLLCDLGRFEEAGAEIELLGDTNFHLVRRANHMASILPWLAEACFLLRDEARMQTLYGELLPLAGRNISLQARVCFGPAAFYLGMLATGLGRVADALEHFDAAHELAVRMQGRPLMAMIEVEHARALAAAGEPAQAAALLTAARDTATALGFDALIQKVAVVEGELRQVGARIQAAVVEASRAGGRGGRVLTFPGRAPQRPGPDAERPTGNRPSGSPAIARRDRTATFRREGPLWTVAAGATVLRCKDSKGLHYLAHLLRNPGKSLHAVELVALDEPEPRAASDRMNTEDLGRLGMRVGTPTTAEPIVDAKALAAYRSRLEDLSIELAEAAQFNDLGRSTKLREEMDVLTQALASAVGLGGRIRATGSFLERSRLNVTRAIRSAIARISEGHAEIGAHLANSVRTGTFCIYAPEPDHALQWQL